MNKYWLVCALVALLFAAGCNKDDKNNNNNNGSDAEVSYRYLLCDNGPYNCTKNNNQYTASYAHANITNGVLTIEIESNLTITVTYTGLGSYSTNNTDLMYELCTNNGSSYICYRTDLPPQTGGYMEVLSNEGGYIEGNFRFIGHTSASSNVTNRPWNGMDDGLYRIKLD